MKYANCHEYTNTVITMLNDIQIQLQKQAQTQEQILIQLQNNKSTQSQAEIETEKSIVKNKSKSFIGDVGNHIKIKD